MSETKLGGADRFLIGLALVADLVSVLSFLGIQSSTQVRWIVVATLTLLGVTSSGVTLITSVTLWYSPKGSLYPAGYHSKKIFTGLIALVISIVLGAFLISQAIHTTHYKTKPRPTNSPTHAKSLGSNSVKCLGSELTVNVKTSSPLSD